MRTALGMHPITVKLDRIFDVHRIPATRFTRRHTRFGFESGGLKKYFVGVPGWPRLQVGDELMVLLRRPADWQTVEGWFNVSSGEVVHADLGRLYGALGTGVVMTLGLALHPAWSPFWAASAALASLLVLQEIVVVMRARTRLVALRATLRPA